MQGKADLFGYSCLVLTQIELDQIVRELVGGSLNLLESMNMPISVKTGANPAKG